MLNEVRLIGRLGSDPEIRLVNSGKKVATMSVSTWESWFNKETQQFDTQTEWHRVVCWGDQAQRIEKMKKGDLVLVTGSVRTREYTDAHNNRRWTTEIVGYAKAIPNSHGNASKGAAEVPDPENDDLPF